MLFWIFCLILIAGIVWWIIDWNCHIYSDWACYIYIGLIAIGATAIIVSLVIFGCNYIGVDAYADAAEAGYDVLVYELENDVFNTDIGKKELFDKIRDWNEDLAWRKAAQDDFWIGIYIPDIYDQFKPILLK